MPLSKSNYLNYLRHPAWLWLALHDKQRLPPVDAATQALFDAGHEFEPYAEMLWPGGVTLGWNPADFGSYNTLPARTERAILNQTPVIFQGRLEVEGLTAIFDVLERVNDQTFDLYEIKSSTRVKDEHLLDLAFQARLLELAGYTVRKIGVTHVNSQYVRQGDIDASRLCRTVDVTEEVKCRREQTIAQIAAALEVAAQPDCPDLSPRFAASFGFSEWLKVYGYLHPDLPADSIYRLTHPSARLIGELEDAGLTHLADIPDTFSLSAAQRRQVDAARSGRTVDQTRLTDWLSRLEYPLYFLDYETAGKLIPPFDGMRPYEAIPFQYSLHVVDTPGAAPRHLEYLHDSPTDMMTPLVTHLRADIGPAGSIIVWSQSFEKGCHIRMASHLPEHADWLLALNDRVVDLMIPFAAGWFTDPAFVGSASIKKILPVLVPDLSYKDLAIHEGGTAQQTWMSTILDGQNPDHRNQILTDLRQYCALDTLAMVEIYKFLSI
jgi:hypothetical protein